MAALLLAACAGPTPRDPEIVSTIQSNETAYAEGLLEEAQRARGAVVRRLEAISRGETADDTYDLLLFSGGAEWGAFGAGYMARWAELDPNAPVRKPEFDGFGGISAGALMAGFVVSDEAQRYADLERFFRQVDPSWISFVGAPALLFPSTQSLFDNQGVKDAVSAAMTDDLIAELRAAHADDVAVWIGTINLDYGRVRYWDLAEVAAVEPNPRQKLIDILVAATSIAGIFPPQQVEGLIYGDLGYVEGIPALNPAGIQRIGELWTERNGNTPMPTFRLWLIYNINVSLTPEATRLNVFDLAQRGYQTLIQGTFKAPLETAVLLAEATRSNERLRIEVNWIAIPRDFRPDPTAERFDPKIAVPLADMGRELVTAPNGGWRSEFPE